MGAKIGWKHQTPKYILTNDKNYHGTQQMYELGLKSGVWNSIPRVWGKEFNSKFGFYKQE